MRQCVHHAHQGHFWVPSAAALATARRITRVFTHDATRALAQGRAHPSRGFWRIIPVVICITSAWRLLTSRYGPLSMAWTGGAAPLVTCQDCAVALARWGSLT
jgi:hypothetical protein